MQTYTTKLEGLHQIKSWNTNMTSYKIYNDENYDDDWMDLNHQQNFNNIISKVHIIDKSLSKVGKNLTMNRMNIINVTTVPV